MPPSQDVTDLLQLSRREARRIAIRAQLLAADRPTDLMETARHLTLLQNDPAEAVARSADLVAWSRLGDAHRPGDLANALASGQLVELDMMLRPAEDIALYTAEMATWPGRGPLKEWQEEQRDWVAANDECRREILAKLYDEGPLPARHLPDTTLVPWQSSGWNNDRNVRKLVDLLVARGEVAAAGGEGRDRLWDLAERVYPDVPAVPLDEARRIRGERRLRALGIARAKAAQAPNEPNDVGPDAGVPAAVEGVKGTWQVDPTYLDGDFVGRTTLLSPLDRLVLDRKRQVELLEFDYQLEMFKPATKRRWGYWAMPVLDGDRLVGKLDATADRKAGVLRVNALHRDEPFDRARSARVRDEVAALAQWLDLVLEADWA